MSKDYYSYDNGDYNEPLPFNNGRDVSGFAIFIGICIGWPVGLGLIAYRIWGPDLARSLAQKRRQQAQQAPSNYYEAPYENAAGTGPASSKKAKAKKAKKPHDWTFWLTVAGCVAAAVGLITIGEPLQYGILYGFDRYDVVDILASISWMASGIAMFLGGRWGRQRKSLRNKMKAIVGDKDHMDVAEIAAAVPMRLAKTRKELQKAVDDGLFGEGAYLDMRTDTLVVRGEAPAPAEPIREAAPVKESETQYEAILRQLREVNDAIPGEEMSSKITRLETVTAKIFALVEEDPSKLPKMRRFMDYYLPTALKLLNAYSQFDRQGVEGEVIGQSKRKIEEAMDVLVEGFEAQLDTMFADDALDVDSDIQVLQNMMARDGLSGQEDFVLRSSEDKTP
ncbi:MAG: 5-bromo-4-chloroindolyl phosphate hydrolysis family protein [Oscillospiraceae bacterium]|nr:5-bromo-4-chloroindolyl phosphate hydrolysis family protein [Oscillospiraceae bacterium]